MATVIELVEELPTESVRRRRPGKRTIIAAIALIALIAAGIGAYFYFFGHQATKTAADPATFVDVPAFLVNLRSADGDGHMLKLHFILVPTSPAKGEDIKARLPLIIDAYQPFLRELRPEDLAGSAAVFRIKEEMLLRANSVIGVGSVKDILIQDLIQQ